MSKTHIDKLRNPNYLGGWDLQDESGNTIDRVVTIKEIKNESVFNQKSQVEQQVITVLFEECKPIILNATNRKTLKKVTGTDFVEDMIGQKIQLTTKRIKAFGEFHDAIRVVNAKPQTIKQKPVDVGACLAKLTAATTLKELVAAWESLTPNEKAQTEVLAKKDELKNILK